MSASKRAKLNRSMLANSGCTKSGIARILLTLQAGGALAEGVVDVATEEHVRKDVAKAAGDIAKTTTPYGPVVQEIKLPTTPPFKWEVINPLAFVYVLSTISSTFADVMAQCIEKHGRQKIVIYIDEARPGNILRPDKGRAVNNIFWAFSSWPDWMLHRDWCWFTFGCMRTSTLQKLPGKMTALVRHIVEQFFSRTGPNFATSGCMIQIKPGENSIFLADLVGFLGDEKGCKEIFGSKGPGGTRPCLSCLNIVQFFDGHLASGMESVKCMAPTKFIAGSDQDVFDIVARLSHIAATQPKRDLDAAEQTLGLNYEPEGVLWDHHCRQYVKPVSGWLRDWQHVMSVAGIANVEVQQVVAELRRSGVPATLITDYFSNFVVPKGMGRVSQDWFTTSRLGKPSEEKDGWKGFSSELLTLVPILLSFLEVTVAPMGVMGRHIESFRLLDRLLKLFSIGAEGAALHLELIERTIVQHAAIFEVVHNSVIKPKAHHIFHLPDHIKNTGKLLSCFVTERKHRSVKQIANHVFRNFENTLVRDMLNSQLEKATDRNLYVIEYLCNPRLVHADDCDDMAVATASRAQLRCGLVCTGDLVMTVDRSVGEVCSFVQTTVRTNDGDATDVWVVLRWRRPLGDGRVASVAGDTAALRSMQVLAARMRCTDRDGVRVLPPAVSATW